MRKINKTFLKIDLYQTNNSHIKTSQLIWNIDHMTGFYMKVILTRYELTNLHQPLKMLPVLNSDAKVELV